MKPEGCLTVAECIETNYEVSNDALLSIIIGSPDKAKKVFSCFPTLETLEIASIKELCKAGLTKNNALRVKATLKLGKNLVQQPLQRGNKITSSKDIFQAYNAMFKGIQQEEFWIILLDQRNRIIKHVQVAKGQKEYCPASAQVIFSTILKEDCNKVILLHNHPSGVSDPSPQDKELTRNLKNGGKLIGIEVLDHIVIGDNEWSSFMDLGIM